MREGRWDTVLVLFAAGLICGWFWELWNVFSMPKWIYQVPFVGWLKLFEMPILGYGGYSAVRPGGLRRLVAAEWGDAWVRSRLDAVYAAIHGSRWDAAGSRRLIMLARLERALERIVEGSIAGVFRLRVQPAEIGRRLERAMLDGRVTSVGTSLAPNLYEVRLHPEDAAAFAEWDRR